MKKGTKTPSGVAVVVVVWYPCYGGGGGRPRLRRTVKGASAGPRLGGSGHSRSRFVRIAICKQSVSITFLFTFAHNKLTSLSLLGKIYSHLPLQILSLSLLGFYTRSCLS